MSLAMLPTSARFDIPADSVLVDDALVARRAAHRRVLRLVPDWIVAELLPHSADPNQVDDLLGHPDRALMELHLREVADRLIGQLRLTIEDMEIAALGRAAHALYAATGDGNLDMLRFERERATTQPAVERYAPNTRGVRAVEDVDHDALASLVTVAAWADALAGDYVDPRIN
jgi:hypothetical protein